MHTRRFLRVIGKARNYVPLLASLTLAPLAHTQLIYSNNFETAVGPEWSETVRDATPEGGRQFLGPFGNTEVRLVITNLPSHSEVQIGLDLFLIRSWMGSDPDGHTNSWQISVDDDPPPFTTTFVVANDATTNWQAYPAQIGEGLYPPSTGAAELNSLGYTVFTGELSPADAVYNLNVRCRHTNGSLTIRFSANGLVDSSPARWGLDNVVVTAASVLTNDPPRITGQPRSRSASIGGSAVFRVLTTLNGPPSFQWRRYNQALTGETNAFLAYAAVAPEQAGLYSVVAANAFGAVTSNPVRLNVGPPREEAPPFDSFELGASDLAFGWPAAPNLRLQETSSLNPEATWTDLQIPLTTNRDQNLAHVARPLTDRFYRLAAGPSLAEFWTGTATWTADADSMGGDFGLHSPTLLRANRDVWCYCAVTNGTLGRARSTDGTNWINDGVVLDRGGTPAWIYESELLTNHATGRLNGTSWAARTGTDAAGFLVTGPNTREIVPGTNTAVFTLSIPSNAPANSPVATVDVYDSSRSIVLASRELRTGDFSVPGWSSFAVEFLNVAGKALEFRTFWPGTIDLDQDRVSVIQGTGAAWDSGIVGGPGVWKKDATYYLAYTGTIDANTPADIGVVTSTDGRFFTRSSANPVLRHRDNGWESNGLDSPTLFHQADTWYVFYSGFDGTNHWMGLATGTNLNSLVRYSGNPILSGGAGSWDNAGIGARSGIVHEGIYYYLAYAGSSTASPSTSRALGLARSTNLFSWTKLSGNPFLPAGAVAQDKESQELIRMGGNWFLYLHSINFPAGLRRFRLDAN